MGCGKDEIREGWDERMTGLGMAGCESDGLWGV